MRRGRHVDRGMSRELIYDVVGGWPRKTKMEPETTWVRGVTYGGPRKFYIRSGTVGGGNLRCYRDEMCVSFFIRGMESNVLRFYGTEDGPR